MFQSIRKHLSPTTVVAFVALVFAMTGGAFAASGGGGGAGKATGGQASTNVVVATMAKSKAKPKAKAGPRGPAGPAGKNGANGANGATGPQGLAGAKGETGAAGTNGTNGTGTEGKEGPEGKEGKEGKTGFTETLPKGKTLQGDWAIEAQLAGTGIADGSATSSISFGIPLATAPVSVYIKAGENAPTGSGCTGSVGEPGAEPGYLCVFGQYELNVGTGYPKICAVTTPSLNCLEGSEGEGTADLSGAFIGVLDKSAGLLYLNGTWAVTAAE